MFLLILENRNDRSKQLSVPTFFAVLGVLVAKSHLLMMCYLPMIMVSTPLYLLMKAAFQTDRNVYVDL